MASLLLSTGKYLHTAYAVSNIAEEFTNDDWSLSSQEGFGYIGQYIDDSAVDSSDPTDYVWTEFLDEDVDDLDDEGDMPMADFQSQIDALQDQIEILQGDAENLQSSIEVNASNVADSAQLASEAADIANATGQYFWHDANGAHVSTEENNPEGERNSIWNSLGMLFRKGATNLLAVLAGGASGTDPKGIAVYDGEGNDAENVVASFTDSGSVIGKQNDMHMEVLPNKLSGKAGGTEYFRVGNSKNLEVTQHYLGDGTDKTFSIYTPISTPTVFIDGVETTAFTWSASSNWGVVTFTTAPSDGSEITITYTSTYNQPHFVFGSTTNEGNPPGYSVAVGYNVEANGLVSTALGLQTEAYGRFSIAGGSYCKTFGEASMAIGGSNITRGDRTFALGSALETYPNTSNQLVIGHDNEIKNGAFLIGNGGGSTRANIFEVAWSGNVNAKGQYQNNGNPIFRVVTGIEGTLNSSIASGARGDVVASYTLPSGYNRVLGVRAIDTNHQTALVLTSYDVSGDGSYGATVTLTARFRNVTSSAVASGTTATWEICIGIY